MVYITPRKITAPTPTSLYDICCSATTIHLLIKLALLVLIIWVALIQKPTNILNHKHEKLILTSIVIVSSLIITSITKRGIWHPDDLFFLSICLIIWVYTWHQGQSISGFISAINNADTSSNDILLPNPGTSIMEMKGARTAAEFNLDDKRVGNLAEHYDYFPDDMAMDKAVLTKLAKMPLDNNATPAYDPYSVSGKAELTADNHIINLQEPDNMPVHKLANEVLLALETECLPNQELLSGTDDISIKPVTEYRRHCDSITGSRHWRSTKSTPTDGGLIQCERYLRQNGAGQSKWAFVDEAGITTSAENMANIPRTSEYSYSCDAANRKLPGTHSSILSLCSNIELPSRDSLNMVSNNRVN